MKDYKYIHLNHSSRCVYPVGYPLKLYHSRWHVDDDYLNEDGHCAAYLIDYADGHYSVVYWS